MGESESGQAAEGSRWVTYTELARIRGTGRESAIKLVQRERWRKMPGNDREVRVLVPVEWLKPVRHPLPESTGEHTLDYGELVRAFDTAIRFASDQLDRANAKADAAEQALATEREAADKLREQIVTLTASFTEAKALRERSEADASTIATLRGRSEADRATIAERDATIATLRAELEQVQEAADALRQAEAAGKARGGAGLGLERRSGANRAAFRWPLGEQAAGDNQAELQTIGRRHERSHRRANGVELFRVRQARNPRRSDDMPRAGHPETRL